MCIKVLLQKTSLITLITGFTLSSLSAEDSNLLLKKQSLSFIKTIKP